VTKVPPFRVLLSRDALLRRTAEVARQIVADHGDAPPCLVAVMEGARTFATQLALHLPWQEPVHEIRASSYGAGTVSSGSVKVLTGHDIPVAGRDVLILEDIVDTGRTIAALRDHLLGSGARSVGVVALLSKPARRVVPVDIRYLGFEIADEFIIGFGLDVAGRYRELPDVVVYDSDVERAALGWSTIG